MTKTPLWPLEAGLNHGLHLKPGIPLRPSTLLGGSWVVISRVVSRVTILITHTRGLTTPLITNPEPSSRSPKVCLSAFWRLGSLGFWVVGFRVSDIGT